jgi:phosphohistidine swiveling domain-containing protein
MQYVAAARHVLLLLGQTLATRRHLDSSDDIFFLTDTELREFLAGIEPRIDHKGSVSGWRRRVAARRADRQRHEHQSAPHTIHGPAVPGRRDREPATALTGLPISGGTVRGRVRRILTPEALEAVQPGEIVVTPVIDPGMAPVFGLASGLVAEIGGLLSHGAIIAREYGLPAVVNVPGATTVLQTGEWVLLDAEEGKVVRLGKDAQSRW